MKLDMLYVITLGNTSQDQYFQETKLYVLTCLELIVHLISNIYGIFFIFYI